MHLRADRGCELCKQVSADLRYFEWKTATSAPLTVYL